MFVIKAIQTRVRFPCMFFLQWLAAALGLLLPGILGSWARGRWFRLSRLSLNCLRPGRLRLNSRSGRQRLVRLGFRLLGLFLRLAGRLLGTLLTLTVVHLRQPVVVQATAAQRRVQVNLVGQQLQLNVQHAGVGIVGRLLGV